MNHIPAAAVAAALLGACLVPAPAAADEDAGSGLSCGVVATHTEGSNAIVAVVEAGPWYAHRSGPDVTVVLSCRLELEVHGARWEVDRVEGWSTTTGVATVPPTVRSFSTAGVSNADTNLWVCTEVTVYDPGRNPPATVHQVDADGDPTNGAQCQKTKPAGDDLVYVWWTPPTQYNGDRCFVVRHGMYPPVPEGACSPV